MWVGWRVLCSMQAFRGPGSSLWLCNSLGPWRSSIRASESSQQLREEKTEGCGEGFYEPGLKGKLSFLPMYRWRELTQFCLTARESGKCVPAGCLGRKGNREWIYYSLFHSLFEDLQGTWFDWKGTFCVERINECCMLFWGNLLQTVQIII